MCATSWDVRGADIVIKNPAWGIGGCSDKEPRGFWFSCDGAWESLFSAATILPFPHTALTLLPSLLCFCNDENGRKDTPGVRSGSGFGSPDWQIGKRCLVER